MDYEKWKSYGFGPIPILIEDKASGQSLIQDLKENNKEQGTKAEIDLEIILLFPPIILNII